MNKILECVPNISEGRDLSVINSIVDSVKAVSGCKVLHVDSGYDANRTVITFAGNPEAVLEGAFRLIKKSVELIDMNKQKGKHPRLGAVDVCPLIPVSGLSLEDCVEYSKTLAKRVSKEIFLPVYLYEHSASGEDRRNLADIRRGEYEGLSRKREDPKWLPDYGSEFYHPSAGAVVIGARKFLIAFNFNLSTSDVLIAKKIAAKLRESGGGLKSLKAIGWYMEEFSCAQVSCNFTDFEQTGLFEAFELCSELAKKNGVEVTGSELVGLIPDKAVEDAAKKFAAKDSHTQTSSAEFLSQKLNIEGGLTGRILEKNL